MTCSRRRGGHQPSSTDSRTRYRPCPSLPRSPPGGVHPRARWRSPKRHASRIDLGRRDLSRRRAGRTCSSRQRKRARGRGMHRAGPSARMILRAISPASLWPARDRHGNSPIVAMAIRRGIYRGMRDRRRTVRRGPLSGSIARLDARHGVVVPRQLTASDRFHALAQGLQVRSHDAGQLDHDVAHEPGGPEDGDHDHTNANGQLHVVTHGRNHLPFLYVFLAAGRSREENSNGVISHEQFTFGSEPGLLLPWMSCGGHRTPDAGRFDGKPDPLPFARRCVTSWPGSARRTSTSA